MAIIKSAGLVILYNNKILLVHPTGNDFNGTCSIPKGEMQDFETPLDTAIRETKEEIGIDFSDYFDGHNGIMDGIIVYKKKNGKTYKKVFYFIVKLDEEIEINKNLFQMDEIDWAKFVNKNEAEKLIFWRFLPMLEKVFDE